MLRNSVVLSQYKVGRHQTKMQETNINQTFKRIIKFLYNVGIWSNNEESALRERARKLFYLIYFVLFLIFLAVCACVAEERNEFIFLWLIVLIVAVIALKLVYLLWRKNEILTFLLNSTEHRTWDANADNEKIKTFLKFVNGYIFMLIVAAVFYNTTCLPMFSNEKRIPFFIRYTLKWKHSEIIYWIAYVFVGTGIFYSNACNLITSIIWYLMLNFGVEYEILGDKFRNLGIVSQQTIRAASTVGKSISDGENKCLLELIDLIKVHLNLFKYLH